MDSLVKKFLESHGFLLDMDLAALVEAMLSDMNEGLSGRPSAQDMIRTYIDPGAISVYEKNVIVIDAGGTNFRSALASFKEDGSFSCSRFEKTRMPGSEKELSKKEFFTQIAKNIERFKDSCDEICFCFSYAMTITKDKDGILKSFSKEVRAPEVVGSHIGAELKIALGEQGWSKIPKVFLLNDTVAALLAGSGSKKYSSYIGFILGTGMNAAYMQNDNENYKIKRQIIDCESAKFNGFKNSDFDIAMDKKSVSPGSFPFEKLCSGAYLGPLALETLKLAAQDGLFSKEFSAAITSRKELCLIEVSDFLEKSDEKANSYHHIFIEENAGVEDCGRIFALFDILVDRMAKLSAVVLASCLIQCGEGKDSERPVCVSCNGSSLFKTYKVFERTKKYLKELMRNKNIHYEILADEANITKGTAMAAFS